MNSKIYLLLLTAVLMLLSSPAFAENYTVKMVTDLKAKQVYRFEPAELKIQPGDTVTFVNAQDDKHNVMFESAPEGAELVSSPMLKKEGKTWSHTFTREGTYRYHCHPHAEEGMAGVIIVGQASAPEDMKEEDHHMHHHGDEGAKTIPAESHTAHGETHEMQAMPGYYGSYAMTREASGTAWVPESSPMEGIHGMSGAWMTMVHGYANVVYDHQGGRRGDTEVFSESMLMAMASRPLGKGTFGWRSMFSLDPAMGKDGYPLLLQTGETADGVTHLVDRQHPHDLLMELAATYSLPAGEDSSVFAYLGYPGEPALGPATFMHRFSGMDNPEAPIGHHWLDSTHITFGVVTLGYIWKDWKAEVSSFNGREPDQYRWNFDTFKLDSYSARLTYNPTRNWSLQASHGWIESPEALEPEVDQNRFTASASYNRPLGDDNWQTTFAWGRNDAHPGTITDALLLETAYRMRETHTFFGRAEYAEKNELFEAPDPLAGQVIDVGKLSIGYVYDIPVAEHLKIGIGGLGSLYAMPDKLEPAYGENPASFMLFARIKLG